MPVLHIQLLGEFNLVYDETLVTSINTTRLRSLLAYLVLHRDAPHSRQQLAFLFWSDSSESQARTNLRNLIHLLRQSLPEADQFLCLDSATIQWRASSPFTLDVIKFENAIAQDALEQAVELYRGDLLPDCYGDWILSERERLQQAQIYRLDERAGELQR